ncbi:putative cell wall protein [Malania oleifera]|uniref:putative cell wall protein n=1 Tax=Malania oleifera TaxID=397392 RepID=UPI0025AEB0C7|nr:putative cell wall protein [Malania oleifera]
MAHNSSLLALLFIFNILVAITVAGRELPKNSNTANKMRPQWFLEPDGSLLIPGIGRVMVPPSRRLPSFGGTGGSYLPGGDDTFVPNPGFEIPNPAGGIPAAAHP